MKINILKIDGCFLVVMGVLAGITDLVSYLAGKGPFGQIYFQNSVAIGGFEAHGLAVIAGSILVLKSTTTDAVFFNKVAIAIHSLLGISNLIWFQIFLDTGMLAMGIITTVVHLLLVIVNVFDKSNRLRSTVL